MSEPSQGSSQRSGPGGGSWAAAWRRGFARPVVYLGNNRLSQLGIVLTSGSAITLVTFYTTEFFGVRIGPYAGIIAFLILPGIFALGLTLIPLGIYLRWRHEHGTGTLPEEYPRIDFADLRLRETFWFIVVMSGLNLAIFLTASYRGLHYMDSVAFCGQTCHVVMEPEYVAHQRSPHSRVRCVECHIGPGAPWFVRSKLSGSWQVVAVLLDLYPRPIPTPVENLRPSIDTCEQCHWPSKFHGDRIIVRPHFAEDEDNSLSQTVLSMHTGGVNPATGAIEGIHGAHLDTVGRMTYIAADRQRQEIPYVRYEAPEGEVREYFADGAAPLEELEASGELRRMDCMDCHNRPTHIYEMPGRAMDEAMSAGTIDRTLPFIKQQGMEVLQLSYVSQDEAASQIPTRLRAYYRQNYPELFNSPMRHAIEDAAIELVEIYRGNVFPRMNLFWGTYPVNLGHDPFPGCFRCHDGMHWTLDGENSIDSDCTTCHTLLAYEEANPEILATLRGE